MQASGPRRGSPDGSSSTCCLHANVGQRSSGYPDDAHGRGAESRRESPRRAVPAFPARLAGASGPGAAMLSCGPKPLGGAPEKHPGPAGTGPDNVGKSRDSTQYGEEVHPDAPCSTALRRADRALGRVNRGSVASGLPRRAHAVTMRSMQGLRAEIRIMNPVRREDASNRRVRTIDPTEPQMNRYDPRTPFAFAAVAMTAATLAISVLAPAGIERAAAQGDLLTRVESETCSPAGNMVVTAIDVVAVRAAHVAPVAQSRGAERHLARS